MCILGLRVHTGIHLSFSEDSNEAEGERKEVVRKHLISFEVSCALFVRNMRVWKKELGMYETIRINNTLQYEGL